MTDKLLPAGRVLQPRLPSGFRPIEINFDFYPFDILTFDMFCCIIISKDNKSAVMADLIISKTKSQQVCSYLEEKIRSRQLKHGERLQTVRELAAMFNVSTIVVNTAYDELEKKNLVERCGRRGVFVNDPRRKTKRFLIVNYNNYMQMEAPATYIIPEFKAKCMSLGIRTDGENAEFLRAGNFDKIIQSLKERSYDGVVLSGSNYCGDEPEIKIFKTLGIPVLLPRTSREEGERLGFHCFFSNDEKAWFEAMKHLAQRGYRRIGTLGKESIGGYGLRCGPVRRHLEMLHELGLEGDEGSVLFLPYEERDEFFEKLGKWLPGRNFDAVMCYSDFFALRLYEYCAGNGIRIPDDLAVIGFCGYPGGELLHPGLSTIDVGYAEMGRKAVDFLLNAGKNGREGVCCEEIPYKVIGRGSTAPRQ